MSRNPSFLSTPPPTTPPNYQPTSTQVYTHSPSLHPSLFAHCMPEQNGLLPTPQFTTPFSSTLGIVPPTQTLTTRYTGQATPSPPITPVAHYQTATWAAQTPTPPSAPPLFSHQHMHESYMPLVPASNPPSFWPHVKQQMNAVTQQYLSKQKLVYGSKNITLHTPSKVVLPVGVSTTDLLPSPLLIKRQIPYGVYDVCRELDLLLIFIYSRQVGRPTVGQAQKSVSTF